MQKFVHFFLDLPVVVMSVCVEVMSKNHVKENMRRIRHIQKSAQQTDDESKHQVKALWKLSKFDSVPSRVKEQLQVRTYTSQFNSMFHPLVEMQFCDVRHNCLFCNSHANHKMTKNLFTK